MSAKDKGGPTLEFFAQSRIALHMEVKKHPPLIELLSQYEVDDIGGRIGEIAAYCEVVCDGAYTPMELDRLCEILFFKLQEKNAVIAHVVNVTRND